MLINVDKMGDNILKYKTKTQALNPLQDSGFIYEPERWEKLEIHAKALVKPYENTFISRQDVINAFTKYYNEKTEALFPFIMTMLWGFGNTGYGTYRTNKYISNTENLNLISSAFNAAKTSNIQQAYNDLQKIKGLNVSYISKLLYFATRACNQEAYALIYDIRVARALVKLYANDSILDLLQVYPSDKYKDYESYNKLVHKWAKELNVNAENIEFFLFNGEF